MIEYFNFGNFIKKSELSNYPVSFYYIYKIYVYFNVGLSTSSVISLL